MRRHLGQIGQTFLPRVIASTPTPCWPWNYGEAVKLYFRQSRDNGSHTRNVLDGAPTERLITSRKLGDIFIEEIERLARLSHGLGGKTVPGSKIF